MTHEERYHRDPAFRTLVDMLHHCIQTADYTPTEVREAALLACIHHRAASLSPKCTKRTTDSSQIVSDQRSPMP